MSRKTFQVFFASGSPERRSSLWRVWGTPNGDVSLMNSEANSDFKATFHPPRGKHANSRCHLAFGTQASLEAANAGTHPLHVAEQLPSEFAKAKADGYGRFEDVWDPLEIAPGLVMPFRIGLPHSELRPLGLAQLEGRRISWLPAAGQGKSIEVALMIASQQLASDDVPGAETMGARLLFRHEFSPTRTFLITWYVRELSDEEQMWVVAYRPSIMGPSQAVRRRATTHEHRRAILQVRDEAYRSRAFTDTAIE